MTTPQGLNTSINVPLDTLRANLPALLASSPRAALGIIEVLAKSPEIHVRAALAKIIGDNSQVFRKIFGEENPQLLRLVRRMAQNDTELGIKESKPTSEIARLAYMHTDCEPAPPTPNAAIQAFLGGPKRRFRKKRPKVLKPDCA